MTESVPRKKRKTTKSLNDGINIFSNYWSVKMFIKKQELDDFIKFKNYKYRSSEINTEKQRCRFCLAYNPNSLQHMIQVYLNCEDCVKNNYNCSKTNICEIQGKYELLTKHKELSPDEWIIFDSNKILTSIKQANKNRNSECNSCLEKLSNGFLNIKIDNKIQDEYYKSGKFYVWSVQEVFPCQTSIFKETYKIKIKDIWIEFRNGKERNRFRDFLDYSIEKVLRKEDGTIFKLNPNVFINCEKDEIEYEGEWIHDSNKQNPCIECSNRINKMVFECNQHENDSIDPSNLKEFRVWKAKIKNDIKYFKRKDFETWEEYCNEKITNVFNFIGFDKYGYLVIQRNSKKNPDYLRFTDRELFIGGVKDYIYCPLYTGGWQTEKKFEENHTLKNSKFDDHHLENKASLSDNKVEEYLILVRQFMKEKNIQIYGLEDPIILKFEDSEKIIKHSEFARIVSTKNNDFIFCTGSLGTESDVCIFDINQREQLDECLSEQIVKWFSKETISFRKAKTKNFNLNLAGYYSLAWLVAYVINFGSSDLSFLENLIFDDSKIIDHYIQSIRNEEISLFPTIIGMTEYQEIVQIIDEVPILDSI